MKKILSISTFLVFLLLAGSAFIVGRNSNNTNSESLSTSDGYPFLAKRIFIENPSQTIINFSELRSSLNNYFAEKGLDGSLYFEYLPTGTSIRINGSTEFRAASLMKLPVAMELFRAEEKGLISLDDTVILKQEWLNDGYGSLYQKGAGHQTTLRELAALLLTESDNTALRAIIEATKNLEIEDRALGALDVELTQNDIGEIDIGSRSYSSFLKCLYFACYNSVEDSQAILELLSKSNFNEKLVAGIEPGVKVAHKIGTFNIQVQSDCGIIYLENKNYILCIMLESDESETTNQNFTELSKLTFDYLRSR